MFCTFARYQLFRIRVYCNTYNNIYTYYNTFEYTISRISYRKITSCVFTEFEYSISLKMFDKPSMIVFY